MIAYKMTNVGLQKFKIFSNQYVHYSVDTITEES